MPGSRLYRFLSDCQLVTSLLVTILLFWATHYIYGFHYGWIDDVLQNNYLRGIGLASPATQMYSNQVLVARLYHELYQIAPHVPWYGYFALSYVYIATVQLFYLLSRLFKELYRQNLFFFIVLFVLFYLVFWVDFVTLVTFTKTSIILVGTSAILLGDLIRNESASLKKYTLTVWCSMILLLGFLNRLEVVFLWTVPLVLYFWRYRDAVSYRIVGLLVFIGLLSLSVYKIQTSKEIQSYVGKISHIQNVTDGKNTYEKSFGDLFHEDIRYKSLFLYYWPDSAIISDELLSKWGSDKLYSISNLRNLPDKLRYEIGKAKYGYGKEYSEGANWWYRFLLGIAVNILFFTFLWFRYRKEHKQLLTNHFLFLLSISGLLAMVLLFYKLESRVTLPSVAVITLFSLVSFSQLANVKLSYQRKWMLAFLLFPLFLYQFDFYRRITDDRKKEEDLKRNFISEINHQFHNKVIFFDIWSLSLLHTSLLESVPLNESNRYVSHFESWSNFVPQNVEALNKICPCSDFVSFYNCIAKGKDKFVFVMTKDLRYGFVEEYADKMHSYEMKFIEINQPSVLNEIHYSLIPGRYDFGYFQLELFEVKP